MVTNLQGERQTVHDFYAACGDAENRLKDLKNALAAHISGPNHIDQEMRSQHTWNFFELPLRKETCDYVPQFVAMVQVAKEKHTQSLVAAR